MPTNIEIKARVSDFQDRCALAERLSGGPPEVLLQRDTFFRCARGRLKLRRFSATSGELIAYTRPDMAEAKRSDYTIVPTAAPDDLLATLDAALGTDAVVSKRRRLYRVGQTRIHLDEVEGLGTFMELEVVLASHQPPDDGHRIAAQLMEAMGVRRCDLIDCAYRDLLAKERPVQQNRATHSGSPGQGIGSHSDALLIAMSVMEQYPASNLCQSDTRGIDCRILPEGRVGKLPTDQPGA